MKKHLEAQWEKGMSWENYGRNGWHIDHIKPISSFNDHTIDGKDFKEAWKLSNLRPAWRNDNMEKSD